MDSWPTRHEFELSIAEDPPCRGGQHTLNMSRVKHSPVGVVWKLEKGVPAQVSSSSLEHGSKLRGPRPHAADYCDFNMHSLTLHSFMIKIPFSFPSLKLLDRPTSGPIQFVIGRNTDLHPTLSVLVLTTICPSGTKVCMDYDPLVAACREPYGGDISLPVTPTREYNPWHSFLTTVDTPFHSCVA
ncbi:hypothetical protein TNCV_2322231 [Trichonephila clavipes]|nr:hypothetical protein TNCV_2322231 [Trichonephila clavipes]